MAYTQDSGTVSDELHSSTSPVFTEETISKILALTTKDNDSVTFDTATSSGGTVVFDDGTEFGFLTTSANSPVTVSGGPAVLGLQSSTGVTVVVNDGSLTDVTGFGVPDGVILGSAGNDNITTAGNLDRFISLGTGNSTVVSGAGSDTVQAGLGNATISGSADGHDIVELGGNASDYTVSIDNGHAIVTHNADAKTTDITKIQYVQLDAGKALVFAENTEQAAIATLYETTFGRTAEAGGLQYWFDKASAGESLAQIAVDFTHSSEFNPVAALSNTDFITGLYLHTFGRTPEADGLAYWTAALEHGATRAQLMSSFADIAARNIDGTLHTEATVVGSVTIVHDIV
ncbi:MAG TPA: DUF4214 domain-containing protein [Ramlibacter sp.]|nr:DUF4214 domain-containing protein [Ramlibacter sp.]